MWRPEEDDNEDHAFSLDELAQMIAAFKAGAARPKTKPTESSATRRGRLTKESLEALGFKVLPSSGSGFILPMGPPSKSR